MFETKKFSLNGFRIKSSCIRVRFIYSVDKNGAVLSFIECDFSTRKQTAFDFVFRFLPQAAIIKDSVAVFFKNSLIFCPIKTPKSVE